MKHFPSLARLMAFIFVTVLIAACGGATPTTIPPTLAPTLAPTAVPPTPVPTQIPPTVVPTAPPAPTNTTPATASDADTIVHDAFARFMEATAFELETSGQVSPIFFQGEYTPAPGEDPDTVNLFTVKGAENGADMRYAVTGFVASFIGIFSGFDPDSRALELAEVNGERFMYGTLENESEPRWYSIPHDASSSSSFTPRELLFPLSQATYPEGAFTKTGEEQIGGQACVIYTANREAFDLVLPGVISDALLNEETLVPEGIERAEYRVVICPDGDVARVVYEFDAHGKDDTTEKGSFSMLAELSNYGSPPPIVAPTGAVPLPGAADLVSPTEEPTAVTTPQAFSSLEGEWEGTSGDDSPLSFRIEEDAVTFVNINYFVSSGGCSYSGFIGATVDDAPIEDDRFSFVLSSSDEVTLMLSGEFESNNSASGTLGVKGNTGCGEIDTELEWTAQHTSP